MKVNNIILAALSLTGICSYAQDGFSEILAGGVEVANVYGNSYASPAAEAISFNLASGWYNDARVLKPGKFSIHIKGQGTIAPDERKSFLLDPLEYEAIIQDSYNNSNNPPADISVTFGDGSTTPRLVATALGENNPDVQLIISSREQTTGLLLQEDSITLAQGIGSEGLDIVPAAFAQVAVGIGLGLELKARFVPRITTDEFETTLYGGGLQWELSSLFESTDENGTVNNPLPVNVSLLAGYTRVDAAYDFEDGALVNGVDQSIESQASSLTFAAIVSTSFKYLNFYGGINYLSGSTETNLLGTYTFNSDTVFFPVSSSVEDPVSVETDVSGLLGTVGTKLTLGAFNLHADYTFGDFDTISAGLFVRI